MFNERIMKIVNKLKIMINDLLDINNIILSFVN
jgi:hypothetical protein